MKTIPQIPSVQNTVLPKNDQFQMCDSVSNYKSNSMKVVYKHYTNTLYSSVKTSE